MKRLHLLIDFGKENPRKTMTYCGIEDRDDSINWTYNRKTLLSNRCPCKKCLQESIPEPPLQDGHANRELDKLEYYNQIGRNPPKFKPQNRLQKRIIHYLETQSASTTVLAIHLSQSVSDVAECLNQLWIRGVVGLVKKKWTVVEEPMPMYFKLTDPENYRSAAGRILTRA